jgi:hypothetical protein
VAEIGDSAWTRGSLEAAGFVGWVTFEALRSELAEVPQTGGVYVVIQAADAEPDFVDSNPGGRFKDRDPTVDASALKANWVDGAEVVYIGKADNLRRRLRQFAQFGAGKPIGHWGGRLIWQLARSTELLVAWHETPGEAPKEVETTMLAEFRAAYSQPPFANDPHLLGQ